MAARSSFYNRFLHVLARWPRDPYKTPERDIRIFLEKEFGKKLEEEIKAGGNVVQLEQKLRCLEDIVSNATLAKYPLMYKTGIFDESADDAHYWTTEQGREELLLKPQKRKKWLKFFSS